MAKKIKNHLYSCRYIYAAFFLSSLIFAGVCAGRGIWPFGGESVLRVDLYHQYAPYLEEFRSRVLSGQSLIYSWETGLGKDFLSQTAYYTTSPLYLLVFLFPRSMISETIALLMLLKIGFCAAFFTYYLREHFHRNDLSILIFGLMYAFCAFVTCYYWNIMWLDTVALFPLAALGTERLVRENRIVFYYLCLTLTMIVNFYLAFLVCVMITLYFAVTVICSFSLRKEVLSVLKVTGRFILVSLLSAVSSLIILAPVAAALSGTEVSSTAFPGFEIYPGVWQLISAHFLGARPAVLARNEDMPNIYTGVLTISMLPLYYSSRRVRRKEKTAYSLLLFFMLLCSVIKPLDYLIHGLHFPANLPHRFTFIYSFILLILAYRGFEELRTASDRNGEEEREDISLWAVYIGAALNIFAILLYEFYILKHADKVDRVLSNGDLVLNIVLLIVYACLITFRHRASGKRAGRLFILALFLLAVFETSYSMYQNMYDTSSRDAYIANLDDTDDALSYMKDQEGDNFFRTEFRRFTMINGGSFYHYNGFSQFSSLAPGGISKLMGELGTAATGNSYRYYDPTPLINAMFDIRYVMNRDGEFPKAPLEYKYTFDRQFDSVWVYRNDRALPLLFMVDDDILDWNTEDSQPFEVQNDFIKKAAGVTDGMFEIMEPVSLATENIIVNGDGEKNDFSYTLEDKNDLSRIPSVHAEFISEKDQYIYLYVDAGNAIRFVYKTGSVKEDRELSAGRSLIDIGHVAKGESITVDFELTRHGEFEKTYRPDGNVKLFAAAYNDAAFQEAYDILKKGGLSITDFEDTRIEGTAEPEKDGIMFTSIPYMPGWSVTVDGEKVQTIGLGGGGLIGFYVTAGSHNVVLEYHSPFMVLAAAGSAAGAALFILYCFWREKRKKIITTSK